MLYNVFNVGSPIMGSSSLCGNLALMFSTEGALITVDVVDVLLVCFTP